MQQLHFISTSPFYKDILENVYKYNVEDITDFFYLDEIKFRNYRYGRSIDTENIGKILGENFIQE